jgi:hypothetical protein
MPSSLEFDQIVAYTSHPIGMKTALHLRKDNQVDTQTIENIRADYEDVKQGYVRMIYDEIEKQAKTQHFVFNIFNYTQMLNDNQRTLRMHIKPSTFFTGFFDAESKTHHRGILADAQLPFMLKTLQDIFEPLGYGLVDVSDASRSHIKVLHVRVN